MTVGNPLQMRWRKTLYGTRTILPARLLLQDLSGVTRQRGAMAWILLFRIVAAALTEEEASHKLAASHSLTMLPLATAGAVETPLPVIAVAAASRCVRPCPCDATSHRHNTGFYFSPDLGGELNGVGDLRGSSNTFAKFLTREGTAGSASYLSTGGASYYTAC